MQYILDLALRFATEILFALGLVVGALWLGTPRHASLSDDTREFGRMLSDQVLGIVTGGLLGLASSLGADLPKSVLFTSAVALAGGAFGAWRQLKHEKIAQILQKSSEIDGLILQLARADEDCVGGKVNLQAQIVDLSQQVERLNQALDKMPQLTLYFDPSDPRCLDDSRGRHTFSVGVRNTGLSRADEVAVVLEKCPSTWTRNVKGHPFYFACNDSTEVQVSPGLDAFFRIIELAPSKDPKIWHLDWLIPRIGFFDSDEVTGAEIEAILLLQWRGPAVRVALRMGLTDDGPRAELRQLSA